MTLFKSELFPWYYGHEPFSSMTTVNFLDSWTNTHKVRSHTMESVSYRYSSNLNIITELKYEVLDSWTNTHKVRSHTMESVSYRYSSKQNIITALKYEVLLAVTMNSMVFCEGTPCRLEDRYVLTFDKSWCIHHQAAGSSQPKYMMPHLRRQYCSENLNRITKTL